MIKIKALNHLVLFVGDVERSKRFYCDNLGFIVREELGKDAVFLHAGGSDNHHDLGLIYAGENPEKLADGPRIGLYHSAWEVNSVEDLKDAKEALKHLGVLEGESEHGNSLSLYAKDPDGNEFEVFWMVPKEDWPKRKFGVNKLDWEKELSTYAKK